MADSSVPAALLGGSRRQRRAQAASERRAARTHAPVRRQHLTPLEPRIMMDATLDFGADGAFDAMFAVSHANAISELLHTAVNLVEEMDAFGDLLKTELSDAMGNSVDLFSSDADNPYIDNSNAAVDTNEHATDDTFSHINDLALEVGGSLLASVQSHVTTALGEVRAAMATEINNYVVAQLGTYSSQLSPAYQQRFEVTADEYTQIHTAITNSVNALGFDDVLDPRAAFSQILSNAGDLAQNLALGPKSTPIANPIATNDPPAKLLTDGEISTEAGTLKESLLSGIATKMADDSGIDFDTSFTLHDVVVDGKTLVHFAAAGSASTDADVAVTVALDGLIPDLDGLFQTLGIDGDTFTHYAEFKSAYEDVFADLELNFTLTAGVSDNAAIISGSIHHKDITLNVYDFSTNLAFGGSIGDGSDTPSDTSDDYLAGMKFSAGMFSAGITSIDLAEYTVDFGETAFELAFSTVNATLTATVTDADGATVSFGGSEAERLAGDHPLTDFHFIDIAVTEAGGDDGDASSFTYAAVQYSTVIDWGVVEELQDLLPDFSVTSIHIDGGFALVKAAGVFAVTSLPLVATAYDGSTALVEADFTGHEAQWTALDAALQQLTTTITALMQFDSSSYIDVLSNLASGLDALFESPLFDIDLPFLSDFDLSNVLNAYQAISDALLEPLDAGLEVIGLSAGSDTDVGGVLDITGIVVDPVDGTVLDSLGGSTYSITLTVDSHTVSTSDASDASVAQAFTVNLAVPTGGFDNLDTLAAAITAAFGASTFNSSSELTGKLLTNYLSISVARGAIELRASSGVTGFTVSGDAALLTALGVAEKNNVASYGSGTTGDLETVQLTDLVGSDWMKLFEINLDVTRTVMIDGKQQQVVYRTFTLTPTDGAWTAADLAEQLNTLFDDAGIYMTVTVADDDLVNDIPGRLVFHVKNAPNDSTPAISDAEREANALFGLSAELGGNVTAVSYGFAVDGAHASFASSVEVMQGFVTDLIGGLIPGAQFIIDIEEGALKLVLPEIAFAYETSFSEGLDFDVGPIGSLSLEAQFELFARMSLGLTIGVDILGFADNSDPDKGFADFVFVEDAHLDAAIGASAGGIIGTGLLGVIEVTVGDADADPADNSVTIGANLHVTLVGDDDGDYSNRLSFGQIWTEANSQTGIAGMIGAFALTGSVGPDTDKFAYVTLNDIKVGISGLNIGIEESVINSFSASLADLRHPTDWETDVQSDVADLFTSFGKDDVIDSLYNSLVLINQVLSGLVENMSFLSEEIPVLGVSFIDAMNFTEDLAGQLQAFKDNPNGTLDEIGDALRSAMGITDPNDLILHWDSDNEVFWVSLGLSFLDGAELSYDFTLDLADLLSGLAAEDPTGMAANLLGLVSSLANVNGEGTIILDAGVDLNLTFGIDLSSMTGTIDPVTTTTALGALASVSQITFNTLQTNNGGKDVLLSVKRFDGTADTDLALKVDLNGAETVGEALKKIEAAIIAASYADDIGMVIRDTDGVAHAITSTADIDALTIDIASIEFVDLVAQDESFDTDYTAVAALFGGSADLVPDIDGNIIGTADLADAAFDPAAAHSFALIINGSEPIVVTVGAWVQPTPATPEPARDLAGFMSELQDVLATLMVSRVDVGLGAFGSIPLDKLLTASLVTDGAERHLELSLSNFAPIINGTGYGDDFVEGDQITLTLTGLSKGATSDVKLEDLGGSNLAAALGFAGDDSGPASADDGSLEGAALTSKPSAGGVSAFFATEDVDLGVDVNGDHVVDENDILKASGVTFSFTAGVTEGLNMTLAMGPLSVSVVDGYALISGEDSADPATFHFGFNDEADGDADGRFHVGAIVDAFAGDDLSISDLFTMTAEVYLSILLPLEDSLGLLDPGHDHIEITGTLLKYESGGELEGVLPALADPDLSVADYLTFDLVLPDFASILADLNPYAILNDPLLLTSGLDTILTAIDKTLRKVISAMDLPIVGDSMLQGLNLFNDVKNAILQPILAAASTPDPITGELPTTVKLLETIVNDALKSLFGLDSSFPDIINAFLVEDPDNPVLYAEITLPHLEVFSALLDVGFDLGIPGFDLSVDQGSALLFEIIADLHIGFGLDRNGFFFLNDTDNPEISLSAVVSTTAGFTASAMLGVVGLSLTANEIEDEDYSGAMIRGTIGIDLFTTLGTASDYEDDSDTVEDDFVEKYGNVVRLDQISSAKVDGAAGQGSKSVAITGVFEVHVNFAVTTGLADPLTGEPITALPSAFADFVLDASYAIGEGLDFERMEFQNLGLNAGDFLVDNVLPVLEQIATYIEPIHDAVSFLEDTKIGSLSLLNIIEQALTSVGGPAAQSALFVFKAATTISQIIDYINDIAANDGKLYFGTFSLLSSASATGVVDVADTKEVSKLKPTASTKTSGLELNAAMQNRGPGITFDFKIFDDVSNVLNLITGNLAEVDLFEIHVTLLDFTLNIDLKNTIKAAISFIPGEIIDALIGGMSASFYVHAEAGLTVGYDLYGIANFLTTGDASDIADGIYFDSDQPLLLLEASFHARVGVNFWIVEAGLELGGYFSVSINLNDPNDDGKMRFSEFEYIFDTYGVGEGLLHLLEGDIKGGIYMSLYYEIRFFFFTVGDSFQLFSYDFTAHFGASFEPQYIDVSGDTATLNVGAKASQQIGGDTIDGDDTIVFNGDGTVTINGHTTSLGGAHTFKIFAGEGNNVIDFSALGAGYTVEYVSGSGDDTVIVGDVAGLISTGSGNDTISYAPLSLMSMMAFGVPYGPGALTPGGTPSGTGTAPAGGPTTDSAYKTIKDKAIAKPTDAVGPDGKPVTNGQTLLIYTGDGNDTVDMADSTQGIIVVSGGDMEITAENTATHELQRMLFSDWLIDTFQGADPDMSLVLDVIEPELARYTALWQTKGDDVGDTINTGSGDDIVFGGNGDDVINTRGGTDQVYAGAGADVIDAGEDDDWVEGGAGADVIIGGDGKDVLFGWGRFDETATTADYLHAGVVQASLLDQDLLDAFNGEDGAALADAIDAYNATGTADVSGLDAMTEVQLEAVAKALNDFVQLSEGMQVDDDSDWIEGNAGDDILHGNGSSDILQGNAGDDMIFGGSETDIIAGGSVTVTKANGTVLFQTVDLSGVYTVSTDIPDAMAPDGDDMLYGQGGSDVMIGGSGADRLEGGDYFNVLIGDFADLKLSGVSLLGVTATGIDDELQGDDHLIGGSVNDVLMGNGGKDILDGGMGRNVLIGDNANLEGNNLFKGVESMVSLLSDLDDADEIYTGLTQSLIVAGAGGSTGDTITTGLSYGNLSTKAERMIIFADYGDLSGPQNGIGTLTTTFSAGDADIVNTTDGDDIIFGGVGADKIASGDGNDIVFGDTGTYKTIPVSSSAVGHEDRLGFIISSEHDALANPGNDDATENEQTIVGADEISGGDGNNLVIGGGGADQITTGAGLDVIVGDLGSIRVYGKTSNTEAQPDIIANGSTPSTTDGSTWGDTIIAGLGDDIAIGGDGHDVIAGGATDEFDHGRLLAMGDFGSVGAAILDIDGNRVVHDLLGAEGPDGSVADPMARFAILSASSSNPGKGDDDELYGGADEDTLIGGDGADLIYGYGGDDLLFGDHVNMDKTPDGSGVTIDGSFANVGGDDEIHAGDGNDIVSGGYGDDLIHGDGGDDLLFGDTVKLSFSLGQGYKIGGLETQYGGDDTIYGDADNDIAVGQVGDDLLILGTGNDIGAGDNAFVDTGAGSLLTADGLAAPGSELAATYDGGVDTILGGDGEDTLIGGSDGDFLYGNGGANVVLGDFADITWFGPDFRLKTIVLAADHIGGDDTLYLNNDGDPDHASGSEADGSSIGVGEGGGDTVNGGSEADLIAGDWVSFLLRDPSYFTGSAFDRIISVESIRNEINGDDTLFGNAGRDIIIAGDGDDYVEGGEGQDLIAGDAAIYHRYYDAEGHELLESRFPFEGGDDILKGGPGHDIIISGFFNFGTPGAGDLIYGDTIEDFLMAGAGSLYIHGALVERFNYLGIAPADNISNSQLSASAGVQLRPNYERGQFDDERPSPFELTERELANMLHFAKDSPIQLPSVAELQALDALLSARILSDEILHLIDLYRRAALSLEDLDAELREALVAVLFDAYGYRLPEPIANMIDRYLELLYERLDIEAKPSEDSASADTAEFARRFAEAFDAA